MYIVFWCDHQLPKILNCPGSFGDCNVDSLPPSSSTWIESVATEAAVFSRISEPAAQVRSGTLPSTGSPPVLHRGEKY